ncbi:MAG TPA: hypothetical protein VE549_03370 [Myxococcaceae bacterium]|nr:hypothetical protein [Myxococcaceae bacterium]
MARNADVFGMDITRGARKYPTRERFTIWPGHAENRIEVEGVDGKLQQLVLMVHEPRRRFQLEVSKRAALPPGTKILNEKKNTRLIAQWTSDRKRHFLCGMDEQHLFVAELPRPVSGVSAAHRALKPHQVDAAEKRGLRVERQGEWFFVEILRHELRELEAEVRANRARLRRRVGIAQAASINRRGRPHVADEAFVIGAAIYARGDVRHPDHRTVHFREWRRVWVNLERIENVIRGMTWID